MLSLDDLKSEIKEYNYQVLTDGKDCVAEKCIDKAKLWIEAKTKASGVILDYDDKLVEAIMLKRALYELYSYAENEEVARDKKQDAFELLKGFLENSNNVDGTGYDGSGASPIRPVVAHIEPAL